MIGRQNAATAQGTRFKQIYVPPVTAFEGAASRIDVELAAMLCHIDSTVEWALQPMAVHLSQALAQDRGGTISALNLRETGVSSVWVAAWENMAKAGT